MGNSARNRGDVEGSPPGLRRYGGRSARGFGGVDVAQHAVAADRNLADPFRVFADEVAGADIAGQRCDPREEARAPTEPGCRACRGSSARLWRGLRRGRRRRRGGRYRPPRYPACRRGTPARHRIRCPRHVRVRPGRRRGLGANWRSGRRRNRHCGRRSRRGRRAPREPAPLRALSPPASAPMFFEAARASATRRTIGRAVDVGEQFVDRAHAARLGPPRATTRRCAASAPTRTRISAARSRGCGRAGGSP